MTLLRLLGKLIFVVSIVGLLLAYLPGLPPSHEFTSFKLTPARQFKGPLAVNDWLNSADQLFSGELVGPESLAIRKDEIYTGVKGGRIVRIKNGSIKTIVRLGSKDCDELLEEEKCGRPLGMRFDNTGHLIVTDSFLGIYKVNVDTGEATQLVSMTEAIDNLTPLFPDDVDIASDGTLYWSDASTVTTLNDLEAEVLGEPTGRLIKFNPKTKKSEVLLKDIHMANGVQLSKDEEYILVSETARGRVLRYYLKGPKKGQHDVFVDGLPGMPDNIRPNGQGGYYVSLCVDRSRDKPSIVDHLSEWPRVRKAFLRFMHLLKFTIREIVKLLPKDYARILHEKAIGGLQDIFINIPKSAVIFVELDNTGNILKGFHCTDGTAGLISEVAFHEGYIYLGSPYNNYLARVKVKPTIPEPGKAVPP